MRNYQTQAIEAGGGDDEMRRRGFVWRCKKCGRPIALIESMDGRMEIVHKCGATNRLAAVLLPAAVDDALDRGV